MENSFKKEIRKCEFCKKEFECDVKSKNRFCSRSCAAKATSCFSKKEWQKQNAKKLKEKGHYNKIGFNSKKYKDYLSNLGVSNVSQLEENKIKVRETLKANKKGLGTKWYYDKMIKKYGAKHPMHVESIKNKVVETRKEKYDGKIGYCSKNFDRTLALKIAKESLKRNHGVENPFQIPDVIEKIQKIKRERKWNEEVIKFLTDDNFAKYIYDSFENKPTYYDIERKIGCFSQQVGRRCRELKFDIESGRNGSQEEIKFAKILKTYNVSFEREFDKINGYRYDFKIGNVLVEINPTYSHSSDYLSAWGPKEKDYHLKKTIAANNAGYRCIHIFDWDDREKIIKIFFKEKEKIYARNCEIREISSSLLRSFSKEHHLQGYIPSKIRYGLFYKEELVSVMTFGKPRYNKNYNWELLRYCSSKNIVGGANKLFDNFIKEYKNNSIISYCDNSKFNGKVYEKLGFNKISDGEIGYKWCNVETGEILSRHQTQMKNEKEIMLKRGFVRVYDCGQMVFVYNK